MQVISLPETGNFDDPWRANVSRLIDAVATPKFESELFSISRAAINCEHITAFAVRENQAPRVLLAANAGAKSVARPLADKYMAQYWNLDPIARTEDPRQGARVALRIVPEQDISD